ncbi:MAG: amidophosphoribosyltransferase [Chitinophagales bacterium]|nr:amidophosphoribosyltransferase [Chitinophagales bacterium]
MSDFIKHECGVALIRLLKPLEYYIEKYGTPAYGLNKLYLLMEKQHNRGQDGAGIASVKLDMLAGGQYIDRLRSLEDQPIKHIFEEVFIPFRKANVKQLNDAKWIKRNLKFSGELLLGHLRYGTHGKNNINNCHPFVRENNWMARNLVIAGNFNLTNVDELFDQLISLGQHPKEKSDTVTVLEKIGHFLDVDVQKIFDKYKDQGYSNTDITRFIIDELNVKRILKRSARDFDGGYVMAGLIGHGDAFVMRDPNGIRPAYYYVDDEVVVVASERPCIQTAFNVHFDNIREVGPGKALIIRKDGVVKEKQILKPREKRSCSFERIYFSRGTDFEIYRERKELGYLLTDVILNEIDNDLENTVFSFIPNTAEVAFYGMMKGLDEYIDNYKLKTLRKQLPLSEEETNHLIRLRPRVEKIAVKDVKMRTFITDDSSRTDLVSHVYDITYGSVIADNDTLVIIDDSIVRGTTLEKSILSILDRLCPKKIVIVSSAPQIRYPDCYGIDMSRLNEFIAFRAAVRLLREHDKEHILEKVYAECRELLKLPTSKCTYNPVKQVYDSYSQEEISAMISEIVKPKHIFSDVKIIYQSIDNLHKACPNNTGDWYFTGNYPTPGGNRMVATAFINFMEDRDVRAYEVAYS